MEASQLAAAIETHAFFDPFTFGNLCNPVLFAHRGCQQSVMLVKSELQKAGYRTWMDIDKMSGSTLEVRWGPQRLC
jgi:hypothetical protein